MHRSCYTRLKQPCPMHTNPHIINSRTIQHHRNLHRYKYNHVRIHPFRHMYMHVQRHQHKRQQFRFPQPHTNIHPPHTHPYTLRYSRRIQYPRRMLLLLPPLPLSLLYPTRLMSLILLLPSRSQLRLHLRFTPLMLFPPRINPVPCPPLHPPSLSLQLVRRLLLLLQLQPLLPILHHLPHMVSRCRPPILHLMPTSTCCIILTRMVPQR